MDVNGLEAVRQRHSIAQVLCRDEDHDRVASTRHRHECFVRPWQINFVNTLRRSKMTNRQMTRDIGLRSKLKKPVMQVNATCANEPRRRRRIECNEISSPLEDIHPREGRLSQRLWVRLMHITSFLKFS